MNNTKQKSFMAFLLFYLLIAFEFLYMAGPFAAYLYWIYKPGLLILNQIPGISWTTGFFLPHLANHTLSPLLNQIPLTGTIIALAGFLLFIIGAGQVYYAKLFKKGAVTGGLYSYIRHPQYTAFIICSFGMLLLWPRYLSLIMFITLLFAYYLLARIEEKECEQKFGQSYTNYLWGTGMFFPRRNKSTSRTKKQTEEKPQKKRILIFYLGALTIGLLIAIQMKKYAVSQLHIFYKNNDAYLSINENSPASIEEIITIAERDTTVQRLLKVEKGATSTINYLMPASAYISEIPMIKPDSAHCHVYHTPLPNEEIKIIYTRAHRNITERVNQTNEAILKNTTLLTPILEVWIAPLEKKTVKIIQLEDQNRYSNMAEPVF